MEIKIKSYSTKSSLVSSIIFFIIGAILTAYSERIMNTAYLIVGGIFAVVFVLSIVGIVIKKKKMEPIYVSRVSYSVLYLILAILFLFFHTVIDEVIRFIIGAWILFSGVLRLISALRTDHKASRFPALLIVSILLIGLGFLTIIKNGIALWVAGIIMMIYSIIEIIGFIFYSKDNQNFDEDDEEGKESLLIPEKKEEPKKLKEGKVKDVKEEDIEEK